MTNFTQTFVINQQIANISEIIKLKNKRTVILTVLYGCGTWSLTLREEHRVSVFKNRMLRKIIGLKWTEVTKRLEETA